MYYVEMKDGKVSEPKELSTDRTATPNTRWPKEQLDHWGFRVLEEGDPLLDNVGEDSKREQLITQKQRELAVASLKSEGKLDKDGKITSLGLTELERK